MENIESPRAQNGKAGESVNPSPPMEYEAPSNQAAVVDHETIE